MLYNKDNPRWLFSEEQFINREESARILREYDQLCMSLLKTDVRDFGTKLYGVKPNGSDDEDAPRRTGLIGIVIGIMVFSGLVLSLIFKNLIIFGYIGCGIFLFAGISMLITGKGDIVESSSRAVLNKVIGFAIALASLLLILLIYFRKNFEGAEVFLMVFVITFGISGITLLFAALYRSFSGKLIYTREVMATCSGYVRYAERKSDNYNRKFAFIHTSPLFSYSVDGVQYLSVWDEFVTKEDSDISLGQNVPIKVDPKHPENVRSPITTHPAIIGFEIFMAVAFVSIAAWLCFYTASGAAKNMQIKTSWAPAAEAVNGTSAGARYKVTDELINKKYKNDLSGNKQWYVETITVKTKEITDNGQVIYFTDETFNGILYKKNAPEPGTVKLVFYTIDENNLSSGRKFKKVFSMADPEEYEYTGSHKAYRAGS